MTERQTYRDYPRRRLYRSDDSVIFGVCGGIAEYFDLSPWGLRLVWVIASIPAGVLGGERGDGRRGIAAEGGDGLDVGLDTGAAAGVRAGDDQDAARHRRLRLTPIFTSPPLPG